MSYLNKNSGVKQLEVDGSPFCLCTMKELEMAYLPKEVFYIGTKDGFHLFRMQTKSTPIDACTLFAIPESQYNPSVRYDPQEWTREARKNPHFRREYPFR